MNMLNAARWWWEHASIIPATGKKPAIATWKAFQSRRPTWQEVEEWHAKGLMSNLAVLCGAVSSNLVCIDLDGMGAVDAFREAFPELCESTFTVVSGSQKGMHLYFRVAHLPETIRVRSVRGGFEVRANGCYMIAPPSVHPDSGLPYRVLNRVPIANIGGLLGVVEWVKAQSPTEEPIAPVLARRPYASDERRARYLEAAVDAELHALSNATQGERNDQLFHAAMVLGRLVAGGELHAGEIEARLLAAATLIGLPRDESLRTIASGFRWGAKKPRRVPQTGGGRW